MGVWGRGRGALLALGLVATAGPSVSYINTVLNPGVRWLVLLVLTTSLILTQDLFKGLRGSAQFFALCLLTFAVCSTMWSPAPELSGFKSITYFAVVVAYSSAGAAWLRHSRRKNVLDVFWPLAFLALIASFGGAATSNAHIQMNEVVTLYRGLTFNSNFLGMLIVGTLPLPLWRLSQANITQRERWIYFALLSALLFILISTFARASFISAAVLILFYFAGRGMGRLTLILGSLFVVVFGMISLFPALTGDIIEQYVYKGADVSGSLFASRDSTWTESYEGAVQGGFFGLGYGVSYGFNDYSIGLGAAGYGREKANVFLAIAEETGIFGLLLFVGILLSLFSRGLGAIMMTRDAKERLLLFLLVGFIIALIVHSQFEAWMFSPGGALTPTFWTAAGMLTQQSFEVTAHRLPKSARRYQFEMANHHHFMGRTPYA